MGNETGIAYTGDQLFQTNDSGKSWREIVLPKSRAEKISTVVFRDEKNGHVLVSDVETASLRLLTTTDSGDFWLQTLIDLQPKDLAEADLESAGLTIENSGEMILNLRVPTSSNFTGKIIYKSLNDGRNWEFADRSLEVRVEDSALIEKKSGSWVLKTEGSCEAAKAGCVQETKLYANAGEITPPPIKELARVERANARLAAANSVFAAPPGGNTRISLNRGFDKCTAATVSQMQTWWSNSPFYDVNIYFSGRNRGCSQPQLTASWVDQVSAMGWGLIPTVVGYQASCSVCTSCQKHSSDPAIAETQGRGEADIAVSDAANLGLTAGTVLYYDMERYDDLSGVGACSTPVKAFLKGWTDRLKERGYISGVYGSPTNANNDWINIPEASRMHAIWMARWNNVMSVWSIAPVTDNHWTNHQRIHQWAGPRDENWGGVTFNIDNNISDAPIAGKAFAKNKNADFDGDGKSDISVFRPSDGTWYVLKSSNSNFYGVGFGSGSDVLAPGDYDGDGKTDHAVYRPSEGIWYVQNKAGIFSATTFGASGDIPVPADYNGDGKTDIAVFRPSNGVWYIANSDSRGTFNFVQFGASGDKPVPGDYDGDGKIDIAVWRPTNGSWYVLKSSDGGFFGIGFGVGADLPAPGDYDGDGKTDFAVYRGGIWYLLQTTVGFYAVQFGTDGDVPVTGDYDGDNKADVAVYRPSNGVWYLLQSQNGFTGVGFGAAADKPIEAAYLPQ